MVKLSEYTKMTDTNRGEGVLLSYLVHHNNEATPVQLSEALDVSTARIAVLLNKMERKHLVKRKRHPNNNRNIIVKLLPEGKKRLPSQFYAVMGGVSLSGDGNGAIYGTLETT